MSQLNGLSSGYSVQPGGEAIGSTALWTSAHLGTIPLLQTTSQSGRGVLARRADLQRMKGSLPDYKDFVVIDDNDFDAEVLRAVLHVWFGYELEVRSACALARSGAVASHLVVALPAEPFAASTLTGGGPLPPDRGEGAQGQGAPSTYVPARNLVFLSLAVAHAETLGAQSVWVGVNAMDYSGYPDCRPAFLDAFERAAALATRAGTEAERPVRVRAPLVSMRKADIVRRAADLGVDLALTTSCYAARWERGGPVACGRCEACGLRRRGFASAGVPDPTSYGGAAV